MNKIIIIAGPTAVGKTDLSLALAHTLQTEIISADSVQIYNGLDIGSAKPTLDEMAGIPHHLIDVVEPTEAFSVSDYVKLAKKEIKRLHEMGKIPVIVGGTGLYINGLLYEMDFGESCADAEFRAEMEALADSSGAMAVYERLLSCDPVAAKRIHPNNLKRVIRALEINHVTGKPMADFAKAPTKTTDYEVILIGLTRGRDVLYERINKRVDLMFSAGLLDEVKKLKNSGLDDSFQSMQGIGYKEVLSYLEGRINYEQMIDEIQQGSRHYAKRQFTWFKRYDDLKWIDLDITCTEDAVKEILSII